MLWGIGLAVFVSVLMIVHDAAVPRPASDSKMPVSQIALHVPSMPFLKLVPSRVVKLGSIESLGNIRRDQEVWPEGRTYPGKISF